jgi:hypothetical protein
LEKNMSGEKDFLEEFADDLPEAIEPAPEPQMEPAGRVRGPDGKFVKAEAQARAEQAEKGAKQAAQAEVNEPPSYDDETGTVPIHVLKALRKENQELKARMGQQTNQVGLLGHSGQQTNQPNRNATDQPSK